MTHTNFSSAYREKNPNAWMGTFTGMKFWPLDPRPEDINLIDIAHALSLKCRFNGHCKHFYSVAEHSVLVSRLVPEDLRREALMHDAAEAYLPDVPAPVKPLLTNFKSVEHLVEDAIWERYGLIAPGNHPKIKEVDRRMVVTERDLNMQKQPPWDTHIGIEPYRALELPFWSPFNAEVQFLFRAKELNII